MSTTVVILLAVSGVFVAASSEWLFGGNRWDIEVGGEAADAMASVTSSVSSTTTSTVTTTSSTTQTTTTKPITTTTKAKPVSFVALKDTLLTETPRAGSDYLDSVVFIGDSRVVGMKNHKAISSANAFAYNGLSHAGAMTKQFLTVNGKSSLTIPQAVKARQPKRMIVAFGINGIAWMGEDSFIEGYENLLDTLHRNSPASEIIVQSILPVSAAQEAEDSRMMNTKIDRYNERLFQLAEEKNFYFLNTAEALKNSEGKLAREYDSGDGLHFNKDASYAIVDYVLTHTTL